MMLNRALAGVMLAALMTSPAAAQGTLRIAMTLTDIPLMDGAPDQGTEGVRFSGYTLYDPLVAFDLSQDEVAAPIRPGLATEWSADEQDRRRWTFRLREDVTFHDGSAFTADAVLFNFERALNPDHEAYDASIQRQMAALIPGITEWIKVDDHTVEIVTEEPNALLPYMLTRFLVASPAHWEAVGRDWSAFRADPSGTGPWKLEALVPRQRAELVPNDDYWDDERVPKLERLILMPIPEVSARTAALLSGRVDWAESPSPDTVDRLTASDITVSTNAIPHMWPYTLSQVDGSPFQDIRVRKAMNLAVDRDGLVEILSGLAVPSVGNVTPDSPWFGNPEFEVRYDPEEARALLAEAGYDESNPLRLTFAISTSGSGQMYPLLMNEFVQENFRDVGVDLSFEVFEWEALRSRRRSGAAAAENAGIHAINNSWNSMDPYAALLRFVSEEELPPGGTNWGHIKDEELERLYYAIRNEFDPEAQDALLAQLHERHVDLANFIWVVHDVGSRALSQKVQGHVHAKSWFVDFSPLYMN